VRTAGPHGAATPVGKGAELAVDSDEADRYRDLARRLHDVAKPMRVLSSLRWPAEVRETFLAGGASRLPDVSYRPFDATPVLDEIRSIRRSIYPGAVVDDWFESQADAVEQTALMLASRGTSSFLTHSAALYGLPTAPLRYDPVTPLELAHRVHEVLAGLDRIGLDLLPTPDRDSASVAAELEAGVRAHFGADAPRIEVVEELSANALATSTRIKLRRDARFTDRDAAQLLNHEGFIHVLTAVNGRRQTDLPILAIGHPGTTRTQEGLAVFAEFVTGTLELDRIRRLADRVLAVRMVVEGSDFIELYRWFLDRTPTPEQAFESTRRVFRGGPVTGGAPFTKDVVYLSGFLAVSTFVRAAFVRDRVDCLGLLFAGKLDLFAIPALCELRLLGLCQPAAHRPPWVMDPRWVLTWLTISTFSQGIDLDSTADAIGRLLDRAPEVVVDLPTS
jgi:uncharacterized protein (TIGR02421 family)